MDILINNAGTGTNEPSWKRRTKMAVLLGLRDGRRAPVAQSRAQCANAAGVVVITPRFALRSRWTRPIQHNEGRAHHVLSVSQTINSI
jgi:hypothetical protein